MSPLQQKIAAIAKVGAGEAAEQALHQLMRLHMQRYARQIAAVQRELALFEQHYGPSAAEYHQRFLAGAMGDSADIMEWMGLYEDVLLYQERLGTLRAATEA
jgi:hypothetical protein